MSKAAAKKTVKKSIISPAKAAPEKGTVGVDYLAEELDLTEFTVRMKLRELNVKKKGRTYAFTKAEAKALLPKLKGTSSTEIQAKNRAKSRAKKAETAKKD